MESGSRPTQLPATVRIVRRPAMSIMSRRQRHLAGAGAGILLLLVSTYSLLRSHRPPPSPPLPAWQFGNQYLQRVISHDWIGAAALCENAQCAQRARSTLEPLMDQYGALRGYGSSGSNADLMNAVTQTSQDYQLMFDQRKVGITIRFARKPTATWKAQQVNIIP